MRLLGENLPMSAGSEYEVACQTSGSKPPATLTWWKSGVPLHVPAREVVSEHSIKVYIYSTTVRIPEWILLDCCFATVLIESLEGHLTGVYFFQVHIMSKLPLSINILLS